MRKIIGVVFLLLTCAIIVTVTVAAVVDHEIDVNVKQKFDSFMAMYGKDYSTREEYVQRLGIFAQNLIRAAEHQAMDPTAVHGITPFSDLSEDEFQNMYTWGEQFNNLNNNNNLSSEVDVGDLPESFDWREKGAVTQVKMQGNCGSCWAFSTTGSIEGAHFIASGKLLNLSEQQLVDCDHTCEEETSTSSSERACNNGCNGGLMTNAYNYLIHEAGGLEEQTSYPYTAKPAQCNFNPRKIAVRLASFTNIPLQEDQIAANLVRHGPLAIALNAVFMQTYIGGVSCPFICGKTRLNHGVLLVGYGTHGFSILRMGNRPYWIIKNSWGREWGEKGYYRLCRGHGMCGMNTMVSAVVTKTV